MPPPPALKPPTTEGYDIREYRTWAMKTQKEQIYSTGEEMNFELILDVRAGTEWK